MFAQNITRSFEADQKIAAGGEIKIAQSGKAKSNAEDLHLLARISHGEQKALAKLYDKYARLIYSLTLRIVQNKDEALELQQDVFLLVWNKAALFDNARGTFVTWLVTLARNKSINTLRSRRYKKSAQEVKQDIGDISSDATIDHHTPELWCLEADERASVLRALDRIPPMQRKALYLSYYEGFSQSEIAKKLGEPLGTIKTRMRKGMMKLAVLLAE